MPNDVVILSHLTENILRNSTRNHRLLYPTSKAASTKLKPKLELNNGKLSVLSIPENLTKRELLEIKQKGFTSKTKKGENSLFIANAVKGSPSEIKFPYTLNLIKAAFSWHLLPRLYGEEKWYPFYSENSIHYLVTKKILREFHSISINKGYKSITFDLPLANDFNKFFKSNKNSFPLTTYLKSRNLNHHSFGYYLKSIIQLFYEISVFFMMESMMEEIFANFISTKKATL